MANLRPADYALGAFTAAMAVMGLFRGLSGALAFVSATVSAGAVATFGWDISARWLSEPWSRGAATLVASILAFGIVRAIVKKLAGNILSQPSDSIFGFAVGLAAGVLLAAIWAYLGIHLEHSSIATELHSCLFQASV
ncbi:MAG: CvpA family protein [Kiritimatiellae bacterium]|nr:CvpA family protein [Kiritimatiellia bacterium]